MKKEVKDRWLAALRSGEYEQGTGRLASISGDSTSYCCLGVLCDLAVKDGVEVPVFRGVTKVEFAGESHYPPDMVQLWSGLESRTPKVGLRYLSALNDEGLSFERIADLIEQYL